MDAKPLLCILHSQMELLMSFVESEPIVLGGMPDDGHIHRLYGEYR